MVKYDFQKIWDECLLFNIEQKPEEYKKLLDFLNDNSKKRYALEIGSNYGGTSVGLCNLFENVISVDIKYHPNFDEIKSRHKNYNYIISDSNSDVTIQYLKNLNIKFDFIFIDADHSYEGVKSDFLKYKQFLSSDGYVAFHDIVKSQENINNNIRVSDFWEEIKVQYLQHFEFISENIQTQYSTNNLFHKIMSGQKYETWGGIGLIKNINLTIFSHNFLENNWFNIIKNQLEKMKSFGLYHRADNIFYYVYSNQDDDYYSFLSLIKEYDTDLKINVSRHVENNYEYDTLFALQSHCNINKNGIVFYFHSKGTSKIKESDSLKSWRECLEYFNFEKWDIIFNNLKGNYYDVGGVLYTKLFKNNTHEFRNYYSGNFWWARNEYINILPNLLKNFNLLKNKNDIISFRMFCELWIGLESHRWLNLYSEKIDGHEDHIFDPSKFKN